MDLMYPANVWFFVAYVTDFRSGFMAYAVKPVVLAIIAYMLLAILANGIIMLVSPRAWARLPRWIRWFENRVSATRYATRWGSIEIRLAGAAILGFMALVFRTMMISNSRGESASPSGNVRHLPTSQQLTQHPVLFFGNWDTVQWFPAVCFFILFVIIAVNGVVMLGWPHLWFRLPWWVRGRRGFAERAMKSPMGFIFLRWAGAIALGFDALLMYAFLSNFR
jgi:hypothetical protein